MDIQKPNGNHWRVFGIMRWIFIHWVLFLDVKYAPKGQTSSRSNLVKAQGPWSKFCTSLFTLCCKHTSTVFPGLSHCYAPLDQDSISIILPITYKNYLHHNNSKLAPIHSWRCTNFCGTTLAKRRRYRISMAYQ